MSSSGDYEVVFPNPDGGLYRIYAGRFDVLNELGTDRPVDLGMVKKLAATPFRQKDKKTQILAVLTELNEIVIAECKLDTGKTVKFSVDDDSDEPVEGVIWCASESAALLYANRVVLVGPNNVKAVFDFNDPKFESKEFKGFYAYNEVDGLRILTNDTAYFLEKVPSSTEKVFDVVSTDPSAQIMSAYQKYIAGDPGAEDVLKGVKEDAKSNLSDGIHELVKAATYEFEPDHQKYLLKAASFAKNFISPGEFNAEEFVLTLKDLRIVNQLHVPKVRKNVIVVRKDDDVWPV
eukprot:TRINITY_DN4020_c0_g1_i21.p4 TRINITY_DN4020_c0_g1~~TRINITY_DN4020_c0_g1_i21.p4  ORF type:complete len:291 (+),score=110.04 TRINITY_DN4020_c0_g1_i21:728-1600(+)